MSILLFSNILPGCLENIQPEEEEIKDTCDELYETLKQFERGERNDADMENYVFSGCDFTNLNLAGHSYSGSNFNFVNLSGTNLSSTNLENSIFNNSDLSNANLTFSNVENTVFSIVNLEGVKSTNVYGCSDFPFTEDSEAPEFGWRCFIGEMQSTNISIPNWFEYHILGPNSIATYTNLNSSNFANATLNGINLSFSYLHLCVCINVSFSNANLSGVEIDDAEFTGANLRYADLSNSSITGGVSMWLVDADLSFANLSNSVIDANMNNTNLTGANLTGAEISLDSLNGVIWSNTICPDQSNSDDNGGSCENNV